MKLTQIILLLCIACISSAQELCLEDRPNDDALLIDVKMVNGQCYVTVDVVQATYGNEDELSFINTNPKLRTFLIDPNYELFICHSGWKNGEDPITLRELAANLHLLRGTYISYTAAKGRISALSSYLCAG